MLYSNLEVCEDCIHAVLHNCCGNFCHCKEENERE